MYAYIKGTLVQASSGTVILEAGGIGYLIHIPASLYPLLPPLNSNLKLFTSFIVRELSQTLYGFMSSSECECFEILLGVSGIGPKLALSLIGHLNLSELHLAISSGNIQALSRTPGIGKKTAERLIVELRGKLPASEECDLNYAVTADPFSQKINDAMSALINLGYNQMTAQKAVKKSMSDLPEGIHLADLITHALKHV